MAAKSVPCSLLSYASIPRPSKVCVDPDGATAFVFDCERLSFLAVDLNCGSSSVLETQQPRQISSSIIWICLHAVKRHTGTFLLAFILESSTDRFFLLSFFVDNGKIHIIHEFFLGLYNVVKNQPVHGHIQQDNDGQIYCNVEWFTAAGTPQTGFHVVKVNINDNGVLTATILANNFYTGGVWHQPFIFDGALYWRPHGHDPMQINLITRKLNVNIMQDVTNVKITNNNSIWPAADAAWFLPALSGSAVYYYACHAARKTGHLCQLNITEKKWNIVQFDMKGHVITGNYTELKTLQNGNLILSGTCSNASCINLEHIFIIGSAPKVLPTKLAPPNLDSVVSKIGMTHLFGEKREKQKGTSTMSTVGMTRLFQETSTAQATQINLANAHSAVPQAEIAKPMTRQQSIASLGNMGGTIKWTPGNKYKVQEELGKGSFGVVHKCCDLNSHRLFVAKKLIINNETHLKICENEISALKNLNHPRIIEYYGCRAEEENIVIFMEYMAAGSLRRVIDNIGRVAEDKVLEYIEQILEGLVYIHEKNLVHRDIKCDNLLLDGQGNIKLGDFGIAVQSQTYISVAGAFGGTCYFMAPEVMKEERMTRGADIWSLGCTIVEMCTTQPPYKEKKQSELIAGIYNNNLSYNTEELLQNFVSEKLKRFVASLLIVDLSRRPHTAAVASLIFNQFFALPLKS
uniref:Protein kinase domain-containing protein n=1 Tax=Plectus sambesii TaxID=2011161 RepID=A0A914XMP1_9BILA